MKKCVAPEQPGGVRDYPPEDMIARQRIIRTVQGVFEEFGFDPLETPAMERMEVLTGGRDDFPMAMYETTIVPQTADVREDHRTGLRFDLTVPLARFVAAHPELPRPFKRYQIGSVWRGEKPQKGRFREFLQFDVDIVGASNIQADVEIIWLMYETMLRLGIEEFQIKINNRKVLNGLPAFVGFDSGRINSVLRAVDKLDKIGRDVVIENLKISSESVDGIGLNDEQVARLFSFLNLAAEKPMDLLEQAARLLTGNRVAEEGIAELKDIVRSLEGLNLDNKRWRVDFSIARGLEYYTGPVFETVLTNFPGIGSVLSGGRYDGLMGRFIENAVVPATGTSVGIDRLYVALVELEKMERQQTNAQVMLLRLDEKLVPKYNQLLMKIRKVGFSASLYLGEERSFKGQFTAALKLGAPILLILGEGEAQRGTVQVRNTRTRTQKEIPVDDVLEELKVQLHSSWGT